MNKNILIESLDSLIGENNNNDLRFKSEHKLLQKNLLQKNFGLHYYNFHQYEHLRFQYY